MEKETSTNVIKLVILGLIRKRESVTSIDDCNAVIATSVAESEFENVFILLRYNTDKQSEFLHRLYWYYSNSSFVLMLLALGALSK